MPVQDFEDLVPVYTGSCRATLEDLNVVIELHDKRRNVQIIWKKRPIKMNFLWFGFLKLNFLGFIGAVFLKQPIRCLYDSTEIPIITVVGL